jgi:hypothetical protein
MCNNDKSLQFLHYDKMTTYSFLEYFYVTWHVQQSLIRTRQMPTSIFFRLYNKHYITIFTIVQLFQIGNKVLLLLSQLNTLTIFAYQNEGTDKW